MYKRIAYTRGMKQKTVFDRLVAHFGTQRKFADAMSVKPQSITKWKNQIPADRVLEVERLVNSQVTRHEMRPDVFGSISVAS